MSLREKLTASDQTKATSSQKATITNLPKAQTVKSLAKMLLDKGDRKLVEAAPKDRIWGIGFGEKHAEQFRKEWG